jgi:uncharacterized cupredoxin-like copper-binding protein
MMRLKYVALALVLVLAAPGCGGKNASEKSSTAKPAGTAQGSGSETTLVLAADPSKLRFDKDSLSAKAGTVTIKMSNPSSLPHNIGITGKDLPHKFGPTVRKGGTSTVTVKLKPGKYEFLCGIDGHEGAGMSGELVVQ